jgi:hypothetical protein
MTAALDAGDIVGAVSDFDEDSKQAYKETFTALSSMLPQIAAEMSDIQLIDVKDNIAEYDIRTERDGVVYSFYLVFIRGKDGVWRIRSF